MCGIVGYVGDNFAEIVVVDGLKRLEYRGYDSAGLAVPLDGGLKLRRRVGKIVNLEREVLKEPLQAHVGVGHTRWATHGAPTEANTHPHTDAAGRIAVVHNGIIENYLELRHELEAAGDHFTSATDTEVVPHLVAAGMARGLGLVEAFRAALLRLEGSFALGLVSAGHPGVILGARRSSPLVVGYGEKEFLLASDVLAIQSYAEAVSYLEDGDVCVIEASGVTLSDLEGRPVERPRHKVDRESLAVRKEGHRHFMAKEIHEQPRVLAQTISGRIADSGRDVVLDGVGLTGDQVRELEHVQILALALLAAHWGVARGTLSPVDAESFLDHLVRLPGLVEHAFTVEPALLEEARVLADARSVLYLGRGINYPVALEGALKLKELSYIHAEGYPAGEMKHGPIALIDPRFPVVAVAGSGQDQTKLLSNLSEVRAREARVTLVTTDPEPPASAAVRLIVEPRTMTWLEPILLVLPLQLLAYHTAVLKGSDVDQPRNLAKSVTVE